MNHHRCTRCKEESYPRHKWQGGVFCDDCIKWIRGRGFGTQGNYITRSLYSLWNRVFDFIKNIFRPEEKRPEYRVIERQRHAELKRLEQYARRLPANLQQSNPQIH